MNRRQFLGATSAAGLAVPLLFTAACTNGVTPTTPQAVEEDNGPPLFKDVTDGSGLVHVYENGEKAGHYAIIESLGGGVALIDYDGDGLLDIFVPGGGWFDRSHDDFQQDLKDQPKNNVKAPGIHGRPCKLYKNLGGFKFKDVTAEVGLDKLAGGQPWFYSHGCSVVDYDRDGWPDLLVTGWGRMALFHNVKDEKGGRKFVDVTEQAGLPQGLWTTSAAWADLDGDGFPDLYVCQYVDWSFLQNHPVDCKYDGKTRDVCPPKKFTAIPHHVFRNNGGKSFTDVSHEAGLRMPRTPEQYDQLAGRIKQMLTEQYGKLKKDEDITRWAAQWIERLKRAQHEREYGKGLGVLAVDVNGDGRPDIYVANDTVDNFLYINRSKPGQILLEELGMESGTARDDKGSPNGSMGVDAGDPTGSGRPDIWVTNYENELHALYGNDCDRDRTVFRYLTQSSGIAAIGQQYVGWGTGFLDLYHAGWEDIFVTNGHAIRHPKGKAERMQRPVLLHNQGRGRFIDITKRGGPYFLDKHQGRGAALGDLDNDGKIDLVLAHLNEPLALLKNDVNTEGHHWLGVQLVGRDHADVVGARLILEAGGRKQYRFAKGGGSYASSGDRRHLFGLGDAAKPDKLTVIWPNGEEQSFAGLKADRYWLLEQGKDPK